MSNEQPTDDRSVLFVTPGILDVRSILIMGINVKPKTDNPIGYFGTGLKYAIAVLVSNDIPVTIYAGPRRFTFRKKKSTFRRHSIETIIIEIKPKRGRSKSVELPFTTSYGKNWELWQAFRELESNTMDEGGISYTKPADGFTRRNQKKTFIEVESEAFAKIHDERDNIFLPRTSTALLTLSRFDDAAPPDIEIRDVPNNHIYYRNMRVHDLISKSDTDRETEVGKASTLTYNFVRDMELTEDRTLKVPYMVSYFIVEAIVTSKNKQLIRRVLTCEEESFEGDLNFRYHSTRPSKEFMEVYEDLKSKKIRTLGSAGPYYSMYAPKRTAPARTFMSFDDAAFLEELETQELKYRHEAANKTSVTLSAREAEELSNLIREAKRRLKFALSSEDVDPEFLDEPQVEESETPGNSDSNDEVPF